MSLWILVPVVLGIAIVGGIVGGAIVLVIVAFYQSLERGWRPLDV